MRVHLGSDHAGLELKDHLVSWLKERGHDVVDHGPHNYDALDDYPSYCLRAAEAVAKDNEEVAGSGMGIVVGGSGNGEQMAANKVDGVRAALVWSAEIAGLARKHNDANVISVGSRMHTVEEMTRFVDVFLGTPYSNEERHTRRIEMIRDYEKSGDLPPLPRSAANRRH